jgi:hypothetical protein
VKLLLGVAGRLGVEGDTAISLVEHACITSGAPDGMVNIVPRTVKAAPKDG